MAKQRGMDAVAAKGKRKPAMKRKPGLDIVIAVGGPPPGKMERKMERKREFMEDRDPGDEMDDVESLKRRLKRLEEAMGIEEDEDEYEDED